MNITNLEIINFRRFSNYKLENLKGMNIIIGKNSIGKTSIIESIYFCSLSKSFKTYYDDVLIKTGSNFLKVKVTLNKIKELEILVSNNEKKAKINGNLIKKMSNYICNYSVILFSPDDIKLIKDSPNVRRNYLNIEISNINKKYIDQINIYNKLIKNKNEYLKKIKMNNYLDEKYLDILDQKIAEIGIIINKERKNYINQINKNLNYVFHNFRPKENIRVEYKSDFNSKTYEELIKLLKKNRKKEIMFGITSTGVHRDDILFFHNDYLSEEYSSQGIQKLIIISMKISEIKLLMENYKIKPILLLDDLFSELDESNQRKILKLLSKKVQVFITTTDLNNIKIKDINEAKIIKLKESVLNGK